MLRLWIQILAVGRVVQLFPRFYCNLDSMGRVTSKDLVVAELASFFLDLLGMVLRFDQ